MNLFGIIKKILKGESHVGGTQERVSGGGERKRRVVHQVDAIVKRALSDLSGVRMLERACADERSRNPGEMPSDPIRETSGRLIAAAKKVGCYMDVKNIPGTRYTIRSGESEVRLSQKDRVYHKIKNPFAKSHLKKHSPQFALFEHIVHNILFPECPLEFIGVSEEVHEARLVYRQAAIKSSERPDDAEILDHLASLGLNPAERYCFGNDLLFVTDVGQDSDNVLRGIDGDLYFIDPIIGFRAPLTDKLDEVRAAWAANGGDESERALIESLLKSMEVSQ